MFSRCRISSLITSRTVARPLLLGRPEQGACLRRRGQASGERARESEGARSDVSLVRFMGVTLCCWIPVMIGALRLLTGLNDGVLAFGEFLRRQRSLCNEGVWADMEIVWSRDFKGRYRLLARWMITGTVLQLMARRSEGTGDKELRQSNYSVQSL